MVKVSKPVEEITKCILKIMLLSHLVYALQKILEEHDDDIE